MSGQQPPWMVKPTVTKSTSTAARPTKSQASKQRSLVLHYIHGKGVHGATDGELFDVYPTQSQQGLRTRRKELVDKGIVCETTLRRRSKFGKEMIVWVTIDHYRTLAP